MQTRGNQVVAGPLGSGARQHRRLDLEESLGVEEPADRRHDRMTELEVLLHLLTPEIDVAIAQPEHLVHLGMRVDLERRRLRA